MGGTTEGLSPEALTTYVDSFWGNQATLLVPAQEDRTSEDVSKIVHRRKASEGEKKSQPQIREARDPTIGERNQGNITDVIVAMESATLLRKTSAINRLVKPKDFHKDTNDWSGVWSWFFSTTPHHKDPPPVPAKEPKPALLEWM